MALKNNIISEIETHFKNIQETSDDRISKSIEIAVIDDPKNDDDYNEIEKRATGKIKGGLYISYLSANPMSTEQGAVHLRPMVMILAVIRADKQLRDDILDAVLVEMINLDYKPIKDFYLSKNEKQKLMHGGYWIFQKRLPVKKDMLN